MPDYEPRGEHFPTAAGCAWARRWLAMQANRMLAQNTIDSYSRSIEDFLGFAGRLGISRLPGRRRGKARKICFAFSKTSP